MFLCLAYRSNPSQLPSGQRGHVTCSAPSRPVEPNSSVLSARAQRIWKSFRSLPPRQRLQQNKLSIFFRERSGERLQAVGIGSFGPIDLHPLSPTFGHITSTPKPGWQNFDLVGAVRNALSVPVGFDTDVNAAALGEARWGAAQILTDFIYLTVGTGIGGGALINGQLLHGLVHAEMGHIRIPHDLERDPYAGSCPFHGDCLEGLASGPAMEARWQCAPCELPTNHPAWP